VRMHVAMRPQGITDSLGLVPCAGDPSSACGGIARHARGRQLRRSEGQALGLRRPESGSECRGSLKTLCPENRREEPSLLYARAAYRSGGVARGQRTTAFRSAGVSIRWASSAIVPTAAIFAVSDTMTPASASCPS
jgi:hypothetical protein